MDQSPVKQTVAEEKPQSSLPQTPSQPPSPITTKQSSIHPTFIILLGITALVLFLFTGYLMFKTNTFFPSPTPTPTTLLTPVENKTNVSFVNPYTVVIKVDPSASSSSAVYIKNTKNNEEELFAMVPDVYTQHYQPADFVNGSLYIIRRTGGNEGYINIPNWTDELWKYDKNGKSQKLYSLRGLSFLVSPNGEYISITNNESVTILNGQGRALKTFGSRLLSVHPEDTSSVSLLSIDNDGVFIGDMAGPTLTGLLSVRFARLDAIMFDISKLDIGTEYAINPARNLLAYSDYPALFDVSSAESFKKSATTVVLSVYNLNAKTNEVIAQSNALQFSPVWVSADTLQYTDASGSGTVEKKF